MFRSHSDVSLCPFLSQNQWAYPRVKMFFKKELLSGISILLQHRQPSERVEAQALGFAAL